MGVLQLAEEIDNLDVDEKMDLIDRIWRGVEIGPDLLSDAHREMLDRREASSEISTEGDLTFAEFATKYHLG